MAKKKTTRLAVTQVRSGIGSPGKHRRTLEALGFRKHQQTVIHDDTPAIRGMIAQIPHLVSVEEVEE
jgi:large subunit ribosomal protein L30